MTSEIRIAIAGVGNCASSLVQGLQYYAFQDHGVDDVGLVSRELAGYSVNDIKVVAAFDVDSKKVGLDVSDAILEAPNNTMQFCKVPPLGVIVERGPILDGWGDSYRRLRCESEFPFSDVPTRLREVGADVLICYLPAGSEDAARYYAEAALRAEVGFINCIPVFIASDPTWGCRFTKAKVPIIGDDIKAQVGATIVHRVLARLIEERGGKVARTYQLNTGGNMDFLNMTEPDRVVSKKQSKVNSVRSQLLHAISDDDIQAGPAGFVPWLEDRKVAFIRLEGQLFGGTPLTIEVKLDCWDSPNSAGIVIDGIRCVKLAQDRGIGGPLIVPSAYMMKSPPQQMTDHQAKMRFDEFVRRPG